jgi:cytochrome P450
MNLDLTSSHFRATAYAHYDRLREQDPVHKTTLSKGREVWLVTRYADVEPWLKDERLSKDPRKVNAGMQLPAWLRWFKPLAALDQNMLDLDPPDHTRLRKLVHRAFTPRRIEGLQVRIGELSDELLDRGLRRGQMDLVADYALPIPVTIICELLGIPAEDHERLHRWTQVLVSINPANPSLRVVPPILSFLRYLRALVKSKRQEPDDGLVSALVTAEEDGDQLSNDELLAMIVLLVVAGHETTVNLIANGTLALLEHRDQLERLRAEPALGSSAVEELLRFYTPVEIATERYALEPLQIGGVAVPAGAMVCLGLGSANRDPEVFEQPAVLDVGRQKNRHLAFGNGRHFCLGAPLARLEAGIALNNLVQRLPALRRATTGPVRWKPGLNLRSLEELPVLC